jgi:hypothetical protein
MVKGRVSAAPAMPKTNLTALHSQRTLNPEDATCRRGQVQRLVRPPSRDLQHPKLAEQAPTQSRPPPFPRVNQLAHFHEWDNREH